MKSAAEYAVLANRAAHHAMSGDIARFVRAGWYVHAWFGTTSALGNNPDGSRVTKDAASLATMKARLTGRNTASEDTLAAALLANAVEQMTVDIDDYGASVDYARKMDLRVVRAEIRDEIDALLAPAETTA